jgi:tripartite-type tricarboxylate transporter receptor subunit TctC
MKNVCRDSRRTAGRGLLRLLAAVVCVSAVPLAHGQDAGNKPIRLVVPFTPGGSTDIIARVIGSKLGTSLGRTVIVDNRPGAGGSIGAAEVARARPDGDTLLMGHIGTLAVNPWLYPKLAYDPVKSFAPIAYVARVPNVLVVNSASSITSIGQLIERARVEPTRLTYASGGNGSAAHLVTEALKLSAKISLTHVPYRGTAPAVNDVMAGQVDLTFTGTPPLLPQIKAGRLRALAVSSLERLPSLPQVPTVAESGYPGFDADQWYGVVAPAGTPPSTVSKLNEAINDALAQPDVLQSFADQGAEPVRASPQVFADLIARELPRWKDVVRGADMKVE